MCVGVWLSVCVSLHSSSPIQTCSLFLAPSLSLFRPLFSTSKTSTTTTTTIKTKMKKIFCCCCWIKLCFFSSNLYNSQLKWTFLPVIPSWCVAVVVVDFDGVVHSSHRPPPPFVVAVVVIAARSFSSSYPIFLFIIYYNPTLIWLYVPYVQVAVVFFSFSSQPTSDSQTHRLIVILKTNKWKHLFVVVVVIEHAAFFSSFSSHFHSWLIHV